MRHRVLSAIALAMALAGCAGSARFDAPVDDALPQAAPSDASDREALARELEIRQAVAPTPPSPSFVWARSDGLRMATNPELKKQGERDRAGCEGASNVGGGVDLPTMELCMSARGYFRRDP